MGNEAIKGVIDKILNEKRSLIQLKIDKVKNNISAQLEQLKELKELAQVKIPAGLDMGAGATEQVGSIHRAIMKVSTADNQLNLINSLLEGLNYFCTRAALFLIKGDKLVGWKGTGFSNHGVGIKDEEVKKIFFSYSANTVFKRVLETKESYSGAPLSEPDDHLIFSRLGGKNPQMIYVLPFFVKGKPQAVIYTDSFGGKAIGKKEVEMVSIVGEMSLDLLPLRQKMLSRVRTREFVEEEPGAPSPAPSPAPAEEYPGDDNEITLPSVKESDPERLARVIINDIVLYNKKQVEEGRQKRVLFKGPLEVTIMQAKELYLIKYNDLSIFERQLVKQLAKGDKDALRGFKFETL
ncbi:MAG: hypothetical protein KAW12_14160 [Candidatus Aminicenantes bacterium]|nr:hypothetical protein [Candidatus Aminicenantes bacterium]